MDVAKIIFENRVDAFAKTNQSLTKIGSGEGKTFLTIILLAYIAKMDYKQEAKRTSTVVVPAGPLFTQWSDISYNFSRSSYGFFEVITPEDLIRELNSPHPPRRSVMLDESDLVLRKYLVYFASDGITGLYRLFTDTYGPHMISATFDVEMIRALHELKFLRKSPLVLQGYQKAIFGVKKNIKWTHKLITEDN